MNKKEKIQKAIFLKDIAEVFDKSPSKLAYLLYRFPKDRNTYKEFEIPKKSGGIRKIKAPIKSISYLQQKLLTILNEIYIPQKCVQGCVKDKKRGIINNAKIHSNKKYLVNIDIKDFFPSINFGRVRGMFLSNPYYFSSKTATVLAQIATYNNELPVGSPSSPMIANMVASHLDYDILKYIRNKRISVKYTRYVDDMSFSCNNSEHLKYIFDIENNEINQELLRIIEKNNFNIQEHKTRYAIKSKRQEVTGLVCNEKVNVKKEFYQKVRNMVHNFYYENDKGENISEEVIRGNISFLFNIKNRSNKLEKDSNSTKEIKEYKSNTSYKTLDKLLWKYNLGRIKNEASNSKVVVLVEGQTDVIYLKEAFKQYKNNKPNIPDLIFMNLFCGAKGSGATQLKWFLVWIANSIKKYKHEKDTSHLKILNTKFNIIADNDKEGRDVKTTYDGNEKSLKNIEIFLLEKRNSKNKGSNNDIVIEDLLIIKKQDPKQYNYIEKLKNDKSLPSIEEVIKQSKSSSVARALVKNYNINYSNFFKLFDKVLKIG
ncbi:MAG: reverse transcriptase family protein [Alphaproteobacteria bacterium]|jgi:hypothetical protein|nr:reverse transcriptase family protein [Alphaproteobacteria bacterium]